MFFWLKKLLYPNRPIWKCSNCKKHFHWNSKESITYFYLNIFTEKHERFVFCRWSCYEQFYIEFRETPYMKTRKEIRILAAKYLLNDEVLLIG